METDEQAGQAPRNPDILTTAARATAGAIGVIAFAFALWKLRGLVVLLFLALTFAAAMRPGVEWLQRRRVPQAFAILIFFVLVLGVLFLFSWLAVPPTLHQLSASLTPPTAGAHASGIRHSVLAWLDAHLHELPSGSAILHPIAAYGHKATDAVVAVFFTLAATWYWVSERDSMISLLSALAPEAKRAKARQTYLEIDRRLGAYTRLRFLMVAAVAAVLAVGFYLVGLDYWLLVAGFVSLLEIIPVIGPLVGAVLVLAVGLSESVHVGVLALIVLIAVREVQTYVVNPHVMGHSLGLSPLVTLVCVSAVGLIFGALAVVLAIPVTSTVATLIDVFVLNEEPPKPPPRRLLRPRRTPPPA